MKARISSLKTVFIQIAKSTRRDQKAREKKNHTIETMTKEIKIWK